MNGSPTASAGPMPRYLAPRRVALGRDVRLSSADIADALAAGLMEAGVQVVDLGLCGTEQVYFYTAALKLDGGIMVTASHNPPQLQRHEIRPGGVPAHLRGQRFRGN